MNAVDQYLADHADEHLEELKALLRIASVSGDPAFRGQCREAATFVHAKLQEMGCTSELVETAGHPIIFARTPPVDGAPTVLVYGHYDVQPARLDDGWAQDPFTPTVRDGAIHARGATDDKGQMLTHLQAIRAWMKTAGKPPVNVLLLIEGEEESGSDHLEPFLDHRKNDLRCDVAVISDTSQYGPNRPAITYGLRGIVACEITVSGPSNDLHSGVFGGAIANPVNVLCGLIASLHDESGSVTVSDFYDGVVDLTAQERAAFRALGFDERQFLGDVGVTAGYGEAGYSANERRWARPTCDVNGIFGGYSGAGPKTIIPSKATAKLTCRLVPNQDPHRISESLRRHFEARMPEGATLTFTPQHGCPGLVFATDSPYMAAAENAIQHAWGVPPVFIREGGSIPVVESLQRILGVETLLLGWGQNSDNLHGPNEHFSIADFQRGTRASAQLWQEIAQRSFLRALVD